MPWITVTRLIDAPIERVFQTVAHIDKFSRALPHIVNVEFLSYSRTGMGTKFRETRLMNGREMTTVLEVTEYVLNQRIRMVADSHGTVWDTVFTTNPSVSSYTTDLTMTMDANAHKLLPKLMNPFIRGMVKKAVEKDVDMVKAYCESDSLSP